MMMVTRMVVTQRETPQTEETHSKTHTQTRAEHKISSSRTTTGNAESKYDIHHQN